MMKIIIEATSPENQRYDTLGDWFEENGNFIIRVNGDDPMDDDEAFLIALHELVEAKLCRARQISQTRVDAFDMAFQGDGEPGDDPAAPYRREHRFAMLIEHLMAHELGLKDYGAVT